MTEPNTATDDDYRAPLPGGGWMSGAPTTPPGADRRPEFSVTFFAVEVVRLLREHGVEIDLGPDRRSVIEIAAADLLRAYGIRPASAPWRQ